MNGLVEPVSFTVLEDWADLTVRCVRIGAARDDRNHPQFFLTRVGPRHLYYDSFEYAFETGYDS